MADPDLTPEAVEQALRACVRYGVPLHHTTTLRALSAERRTLIQALKDGGEIQRIAIARAEAAEARLKEAVEVLRMIESIRPMWEGGVRGTSVDNLSNTLEHMRAEARAFLSSLEADQ